MRFKLIIADLIKKSLNYALSNTNIDSAANELGIPKLTLYSWLRKANQFG